MVDTRFYRSLGEFPISSLLAQVGRDALWTGAGGADRRVSGVADPDTAGPADLVFVGSAGFAAGLDECQAGVALHSPGLEQYLPPGMTRIGCDAPQTVFSEICTALYPRALQPSAGAGHQPPLIGEGVTIGQNAVIGPGVEIGDGSVIGSNAVLGAGVTLGRFCDIGPGVTIDYAHVGDHVVVQAGARLGVSGFGFLPAGGRIVPVPQLGRTIIQDRVEIGANSVIDRGALGDTVIGEGSKIGNLVVIAHNCRIGRNCMIVGFVGLAGSVTLEDNVTMAGGGGTAGHITLGEGTVVLAASWVSKSFPAGSRIGGAPAQDVKAYWAELATLRRLAKGTAG